MTRAKYVGVDGCPYGWFSIGLSEKRYELLVCRTFGQLLEHYRDATLILVDIPIGLQKSEAERQCDYEAKDKIGDLKSAVFPTPTRETIKQVGKLPEGCLPATHLRYRFKQIAVKGISLQTFAIAHKVAEVDEIMRCRVDNKQPEIREVHPEVCFWALNQGRPLKSKKKAEKGREERLSLLGKHMVAPRVDEIFGDAIVRFPRTDVARDDILDALAAAVTAYKSGGKPETMPESPPTDPQYPHLRMEMVYWPPVLS